MTETNALIASALFAETFGCEDMLALRASFRSNGVTNANVRDIVLGVAVQHDALHRNDAGRRFQEIWGCV